MVQRHLRKIFWCCDLGGFAFLSPKIGPAEDTVTKGPISKDHLAQAAPADQLDDPEEYPSTEQVKATNERQPEGEYQGHKDAKAIGNVQSEDDATSATPKRQRL